MPKKKQACNAFYFFMQDYKQKEQKKGRTITMEQTAMEAGPIWASMKPIDRAHYKEMEKRAKSENGASAVKYTSQGVPLTEIETKEKEEQKAEMKMKETTQKIVQNSILHDALATQNYYFVAANYFCHHKSSGYIPAEIAVAEYSLQGGIINKFHSFINPGNLPLGLNFTAREHTDKTHQSPLPPNAEGEENYALLLKEIVQFVTDGAGDELPPLFVKRVDMPIIKSIISQLSNHANEDENLFRVYALEELFFVLKKAAVKQGQNHDEGFASIHIAHSILDRDPYECQSGISCEFHEKLDVGKYCALSNVCRVAFIFSDNICLDLGIKLKPGLHVPEGIDIATVTQTVFDPQAWRQPADVYDDEESCDGYDPPESTASEIKQNDDDSVITFKDENPWVVRKKKVPRRPGKNSLNFGRGGGRGTPSMRSDVSVISDVSSKPSRSYGRGQLME